MEHNHFHEAPEQDSYATGSTRPPKNRRWAMALFLGAVVFLGGLFSALGILNIRLFRHMHATAGQGGVAFYEATDPGFSVESIDYVWGREVSEMEQHWYRMPAGFLLTRMTAGGTAASLGLQTSDVVVSVNGECVRDSENLMCMLQDIYRGEEGVLVIYRQGQFLTLNIPAGERP